MIAKSAKVREYQQTIEQFKQNFLFDQKMYAQFNRDEVRPNDVLNAEESKILG